MNALTFAVRLRMSQDLFDAGARRLTNRRDRL